VAFALAQYLLDRTNNPPRRTPDSAEALVSGSSRDGRASGLAGDDALDDACGGV
jgi:hypothetical protein